MFAAEEEAEDEDGAGEGGSGGVRQQRPQLHAQPAAMEVDEGAADAAERPAEGTAAAGKGPGRRRNYRSTTRQADEDGD